MSMPQKINYHQQSRVLELRWGEGDGGNDRDCELSSEFLRVHSPSAEVRGHRKGQEVLQTGKKGVAIAEIRPVGNYAIQLCFDDGHDTGIYSWDYLAELCQNRDALWEDYLRRLHEADASRDPDVQVVKIGL